MKHLYYIAFCSLFFLTSCVTDDEKIKVDNDYGVIASITNGNSIFNLSDAENSEIDYTVSPIVSNTTSTSGEIHVSLNDGAYTKLSDMASFPFSYSGTLTSVVSTLGLNIADLNAGDIVNYKFYFTTDSGELLTSDRKFIALVLCAPEPGDYVVQMHDSYGDGWQTNGGNGGNGIIVNLDGTEIEIGMCSPYEASPYDCTTWGSTVTDPTSGFTDATVTVTIPQGTNVATWTFPGDQYGEISFEIYGPNGDLLYSGALGATEAGLIPVASAC